MGQIWNAKPFLVLDHIAEHKPERVSLRHLIESGLIMAGEIGREEESVYWIFFKYTNPPHPEQILHRRRVLYRDTLEGINLSDEGSDSLFKELNLLKGFLQFHLKPPIEMEPFCYLNRLCILL